MTTSFLEFQRLVLSLATHENYLETFKNRWCLDRIPRDSDLVQPEPNFFVCVFKTSFHMSVMLSQNWEQVWKSNNDK